MCWDLAFHVIALWWKLPKPPVLTAEGRTTVLLNLFSSALHGAFLPSCRKQPSGVETVSRARACVGRCRFCLLLPPRAARSSGWPLSALYSCVVAGTLRSPPCRPPASAQSADTRICCSLGLSSSTGVKTSEEPCVTKESHPVFSSWRSVLRRGDGVAVKWVSLPLTRLEPCTSHLASPSFPPRLQDRAVDRPARRVAAGTQWAAVCDWCT